MKFWMLRSFLNGLVAERFLMSDFFGLKILWKLHFDCEVESLLDAPVKFYCTKLILSLSSNRTTQKRKKNQWRDKKFFFHINFNWNPVQLQSEQGTQTHNISQFAINLFHKACINLSLKIILFCPFFLKFIAFSNSTEKKRISNSFTFPTEKGPHMILLFWEQNILKGSLSFIDSTSNNVCFSL